MRKNNFYYTNPYLLTEYIEFVEFLHAYIFLDMLLIEQIESSNYYEKVHQTHLPMWVIKFIMNLYKYT